YKRYKIKLTEKQSTAISNFISAKSPNLDSVFWDITPNLDWEAGTFEDRDSCYWQSKISALVHMNKDPHCFALRNYKERHNGETAEPMGRCWLVVQGDEVVIFNAYERGLDFYKELLSRVLERYSSYDVMLWNNEETDGLVWINRAAGVVFSKNSGFVDHWDL